jgi:DNA primase
MAGSPVEEIKARLDIVEFIQSYVRLEKAGINFKAPCPFHTEKTPSFFVSPSRQTWHCFGGCGEGGDIFKFVMKMEGMDFPEALRVLGARAGVAVARENPALRSERNRLYDVCEAAARIFERRLLLTPEPKEYLKSRGMTGETARAFRIGFAPASWDFLLRALAAKGFKPDEAERAGLAIRSERDGSRYDRFRSRIIFPIVDASARVIGFGGRIFEADGRGQSPDRVEAKYINSPQTLIYDKSRALYGLDKAKQEIRARNSVVIVEGYMDCVMSHQAGVKNTIAVSGTALTPHQLKILRRLCDTMICSFDADAAGESATRRSLALAAQHDFTRLIAAIPSGKDPADTVRDSPEAWAAAVAPPRPVVAFYFKKSFHEQNPATADGKKAIAASILPFVAELADEIEKAHWISELARGLTVPEEAIRADIRRLGALSRGVSSPAGDSAAEAPASPPTRRELLEDRLIVLMASARESSGAIAAPRGEIVFVSDLRARAFALLISDTSGQVPADLEQYLADARFRGEMVRERIADVGEEISLCARELEKISLKDKLAQITREIEAREKEKDDMSVATLLEDHRLLSDRLRALA